MEPFHIIIADGQFLSREGILEYLHQNYASWVLESALSREKLWKLLSLQNTRVLFIDPDTLDLSLPDDLAKIKKLLPDLKVIIVTNNPDPEYIEMIMKVNATSIIFKTCEESEFEYAFQAALNNRKYFTEGITHAIMRLKDQNRYGNIPLTATEQKIVQLIAQGMTTKEIAVQKNLSFHTIITHRRNIFRKLGINNSSELVMYAVKSGIVPTDDYSI